MSPADLAEYLAYYNIQAKNRKAEMEKARRQQQNQPKRGAGKGKRRGR